MLSRVGGVAKVLPLVVVTCLTTTFGLTWLTEGSSEQQSAAVALATEATPTTAASSQSLTASTVDGAVVDDDFPDPYVLVTSTGYYAYGTNTVDANVPVLFSTDLAHWTNVGDAAPELPAWMASDNFETWGPSVSYVDGLYVLYVSAGLALFDRHCIVVGTSTSPTGPFQFRDEPLVCGDSGAIDASPFTDASGQRWLLWKAEATATQPTRIMSQRLSADGQSLEGSVATLVSAGKAWEYGTVEGPSMAYVGGVLYLFYAGGDYTNDTYATAYAPCGSAAGPCQDSTGPFITTANTGLQGPGGMEVFTVEGQTYGVLHAWADTLGDPWDRRVMQIRRLDADTAGPFWGP